MSVGLALIPVNQHEGDVRRSLPPGVTTFLRISPYSLRASRTFRWCQIVDYCFVGLSWVACRVPYPTAQWRRIELEIPIASPTSPKRSKKSHVLTTNHGSQPNYGLLRQKDSTVVTVSTTFSRLKRRFHICSFSKTTRSPSRRAWAGSSVQRHPRQS